MKHMCMCLPEHAYVFVCVSAGECVSGRHPLFAGQLSVWGGGVGGVCRVRSGAAEHQTLPPLPHPVHNTRHSGLQRPWECLLHGAAQWWVYNADMLSFIDLYNNETTFRTFYTPWFALTSCIAFCMICRLSYSVSGFDLKSSTCYWSSWLVTLKHVFFCCYYSYFWHKPSQAWTIRNQKA